VLAILAFIKVYKTIKFEDKIIIGMMFFMNITIFARML